MKTLSALALLLALPMSAPAEDTFGFSRVPIRENSDNYLPVPYAKTPLWIGTLGAAPSLSGNLATLSLPDCPEPSVPCYVRFRSGPLAGRYYHTASGSTYGSIIVNTNGDSQVAQALAGDEAALIPFWTLGEFLPPGGFGIPLTDTGFPYLMDRQGLQFWGHQAYGLNSGPLFEGMWNYDIWLPNNNLVSVLFPDHSGSGINLPLVSQAQVALEVFATDPYGLPATHVGDEGVYLATDGIPHWFDEAGNLLDSQILPPDGFIVLRNSAPTGPDGSLMLYGHNEPGPWVVPLSTQSNYSQDNYFAFPITRPTPFYELGWLGGLITSPDEWWALDELLAYWPGFTGFNRCAEGYFYPTENFGWVDAFDNSGSLPADYLIPAHTVFFIRKVTTPAGTTSFLTVSPSN